MRESRRKNKTNLLLLVILVLIALFAFYLLRPGSLRSEVYGTYKLYTEDPSMMPYVRGQDTYIRLLENNTIIYNSTINNKPKFHIEGKFDFDEEEKELDIRWESGKLPSKLVIEEQGIIRIGQTLYKKEKRN